MKEVSDLDSYKRKIKTRDELKEILGDFPREKSVIMCHGTFDIVHPGHVRHLMYTSDKADILVVSLTCDAFINKANYRPYIPEELRAMNLAALETVDYVLIDRNETPLENIKFLKPNYFAKGADYVTANLNPKTKEEKDIVESYGGEMIFTPGDVMFSSSAIINENPPNIEKEKLEIIMKSENLSFRDLHEAVDKFSETKVHVVGDTIVDTYSYCSLIGGGTKTPTLSVKLDKALDYAGGAAIVSKHMRSTGAKVKFTTVIGDDSLKDFLYEDFKDTGIDVDFIVDPTRPTTRKNVIIAKEHRLLKVDELDNRVVSDKILNRLTTSISESTNDDAVVFSDFRHGIFSKATVDKLISAIPEGPLKIGDTQVASRWGNILDFNGFDLITPNEKEARFALGDQESVVRPLALELYKRAECKYLILKLGSRGIITYRPGSEDDLKKFFTLGSFASNVVDPVGSGDALLAYSTLGLIVTKSEVIASILGSIAAAIACERDGNIPVGPDLVHQRLNEIEGNLNFS